MIRIFKYVAFVFVSVASSALFAEQQMPPDWKDTSTSIEIRSGVVHSCPMAGYQWSKRSGPDFIVYGFTEYDSTKSNAGFYLGTHPASSLGSRPGDMGVDFGNLLGKQVLWIKRPSYGSHAFRIETVIEWPYEASDETKKLHFWINVQTPSDKEKWMKWTECFQIEPVTQ